MSNNEELSDKLRADVGKSQRGKAARREASAQRRADAKAVREARREKSSAERSRLDAEATGTSVEEVNAVREGRADFISNRPEEEKNLVPIEISSDDVNQPKGDWSQGTKAGIFTPAPTGVIRGNRDQPASAEVQENREKRIASGMGVSGLEEGVPSEVINHPVHGQMEVPADIAQAHRLYSVDFANNPRRANALAGLEGKEDFATPYAHKGGHYERLARLQAAGENVDDIKSYSKKMGLTEYDTVAGMHDSLVNSKNASKLKNYGTQHLNPEDTFIHPETGEEHPLSDWHTKHNMPLDENGLPNLTATTGTTTGIYKDEEGNTRTTVPTRLGWVKDFSKKVPQGTQPGLVKGTWRLQGPAALPGATASTVPQEAYNFISNQTRQAIPMGSTVSRAQIQEATRAMAAIHAASAGVTTPGRVSETQIMNPSTGLPLAEPKQVEVAASPLAFRDQAEELDKEYASFSGRAMIKGDEQIRPVETESPPEPPSYRTDENENPIPQPPKVGIKGAQPFFVRGRTTNAPRGARQQSLLASFIPVHNPPRGAEGPSVTSGMRGAQDMPDVPGMVGHSTPFSEPKKDYEQPTLPGFEEQKQQVTEGPLRGVERRDAAGNLIHPENNNLNRDKEGNLSDVQEGTVTLRSTPGPIVGATPRSELEDAVSQDSSQSPFTMTNTEAQKFSRVYLEDNPNKGPAQPMLDFGQPEREEEQKRKALAAANGGIEPSTGKRFKRSGQQWGFLDTRWLGNVGSSNPEQLAELTQGSNTKSAEKPRNIVPPPSGLPRGTVASGNDVEPETEAGKRIISGMRDHRSGAQFMSLLNNQNNGGEYDEEIPEEHQEMPEEGIVSLSEEHKARAKKAAFKKLSVNDNMDDQD
jgi:hypothetical protein